jgi:hypothetical protein
MSCTTCAPGFFSIRLGSHSWVNGARRAIIREFKKLWCGGSVKTGRNAGGLLPSVLLESGPFLWEGAYFMSTWCRYVIWNYSELWPKESFSAAESFFLPTKVLFRNWKFSPDLFLQRLEHHRVQLHRTIALLLFDEVPDRRYVVNGLRDGGIRELHLNSWRFEERALPPLYDIIQVMVLRHVTS